MSGGHFNGVGFRIEEDLKTIYEDEEVRKRFPKIAAQLAYIGGVINSLERKIDLDLSGDKPLALEDDKFDLGAVDVLTRKVYY